MLTPPPFIGGRRSNFRVNRIIGELGRGLGLLYNWVNKGSFINNEDSFLDILTPGSPPPFVNNFTK